MNLDDREAGSHVVLGAEKAKSSIDLQQVIANIWADVFALPGLDVDANFFDCGGDSSIALEVIARVSAEVGVVPSVRQLYEAQTPRRLAAALVDKVDPDLLPTLIRAPRTGRYPVSLIQEQSVLRNRAFRAAGLAPPAHNAVFLHRISGPLDPTGLDRALRQVLAGHTPLRVGFERHGDAVVQVIGDGTEFELQRDQLPVEGLAAVAEREWNTPFPDHGPRMRATLYREEDGWLLVTTFDHDVVDGRSVGLLMAAVGREYAAAIRGACATVPEPSLDYLDWSYSQRQWADRAQLADAIDQWCASRGITEPADELIDLLSAPSSATAAVGAEPVYEAAAELARNTVAQARQVAASHRVSLHALLVAALHGWLARRTGRPRLLTFSIMHNREASQVRDMVGWFTNKVPMFTDLTHDPRFAQLLAQAQAEVVEAHRLQAVPFVLWAQRLRTDPTQMLRMPSFVMLNYFEGELARADDLALPGLDVRTLHISVPFVRTAGVTFTVRATDRGMTIQMSTPLSGRREGDVDADLDDFVGSLNRWVGDSDRHVFRLD